MLSYFENYTADHGPESVSSRAQKCTWHAGDVPGSRGTQLYIYDHVTSHVACGAWSRVDSTAPVTPVNTRVPVAHRSYSQLHRRAHRIELRSTHYALRTTETLTACRAGVSTKSPHVPTSPRTPAAPPPPVPRRTPHRCPVTIRTLPASGFTSSISARVWARREDRTGAPPLHAHATAPTTLTGDRRSRCLLRHQWHPYLPRSRRQGITSRLQGSIVRSGAREAVGEGRAPCPSLAEDGGKR